jgi:hypothetical protein
MVPLEVNDEFGMKKISQPFQAHCSQSVETTCSVRSVQTKQIRRQTLLQTISLLDKDDSAFWKKTSSEGKRGWLGIYGDNEDELPVRDDLPFEERVYPGKFKVGSDSAMWTVPILDGKFN